MVAEDYRVEAMPTLFKGLGYLFSRSHGTGEQGYQEAVRTLTGTDGSPSQQYDLIVRALDALPGGQKKTVLENALGGYGPYQGESLADRRRSIAAYFDISPRTVFRAEQRGTLDLIKHIDRIVERTTPNVEMADFDVERVFLRTTTALMNQLMELLEEGPVSAWKRRDAINAYLVEVAPYEAQLTPEYRKMVEQFREDAEDIQAELNDR